MKYEQLTHDIIGCAMKVHSTLGNGFQEIIYQRSLAIEMEKQGLEFKQEMEIPIFYDGIKVGTRRVDFFVQNTVMLEIKALIKLEAIHLTQSMNYCQAYNLPIGLLINFGSPSLEFKRVYNLNHPENSGFGKTNPNLYYPLHPHIPTNPNLFCLFLNCIGGNYLVSSPFKS
jgi:GxxExxY protein